MIGDISYERGDGWLYVLTRAYHLNVGIPCEINTEFIWLHRGVLHLLAGYAWDGPSGPALDTKDFMRASLVHDALYQLMREGHLPMEWRKSADQIMHYICLEDGMLPFRAWYVYQAVRLFGGQYMKTGSSKALQAALAPAVRRDR